MMRSTATREQINADWRPVSQVLSIIFNPLSEADSNQYLNYFNRINAFSANYNPGPFIIRYENYAKTYAKKIVERLNTTTNLLFEYNTRWANYYRSINIIRALTSQINKNRRVEQYPTTIYDMSLITWKNEVYTALADNLTNLIIQQLNDERRGKPVDSLSVKTSIHSLINMMPLIYDKNPDKNPTNPPQEDLSVYKVFENEFLDQTGAFYLSWSNAYLADHPFFSYIEQLFRILKEEDFRSNYYLHPQTHDMLFAVLYDNLILKHEDRFVEEFTLEFNKNNERGLYLIYSTIKNIPTIVTNLAKQLELLIFKQYENSIKTDKYDEFIRTLLTVYKKYKDMNIKSFDNDPVLERAMLNSVALLMNSNPDAPYLLTKYIDNFLGKRNKIPEQEKFPHLSDIFILYTLIDDKEAFMEYYSRSLADRLLSRMYDSLELELQMIKLIKQYSGMYFTSKLEKMIDDIKIDEEMSKDFAHAHPEVATLIKPTTVTQASWPLNAQENLRLPPSLLKARQLYEDFYHKTNAKTTNKKRMLRFAYEQSTVDAKLPYTKPPVTVRGNTFQITVLILIYDNDKISKKQLLEATQLSGETLDRTIRSLIAARFVMSAPKITSDMKDIPETTRFIVNMKYDPKSAIVDISRFAKPQETQEKADAKKEIMDKQNIQIDAAIIRIMKTKKELDADALIQEAKTQVLHRFIANPDNIKRRISYLIEKEYLEPIDGTKNFRYLA